QGFYESSKLAAAEANGRLDRPAARTVGAPAAALRLARRGAAAHADRKPASVASPGAPSDDPRREPERGWYVQLEIRQLRTRLRPLRIQCRGNHQPVVGNHLSDPAHP